MHSGLAFVSPRLDSIMMTEDLGAHSIHGLTSGDLRRYFKDRNSRSKFSLLRNSKGERMTGLRAISSKPWKNRNLPMIEALRKAAESLNVKTIKLEQEALKAMKEDGLVIHEPPADALENLPQGNPQRGPRLRHKPSVHIPGESIKLLEDVHLIIILPMPAGPGCCAAAVSLSFRPSQLVIRIRT